MDFLSLALVDLFCGGGGSSTGFHQAGFQTKFAIDKEWFCVNTFNLNHGNVAKLGDVAQLRSERIQTTLNGKPIIVTASPPCEPFTIANHKRNKNPFDRLFTDPIGRLTLDALRIISDLDPEYYFIENVKGILDGENRHILAEEISDLGLGAPYFNWIDAPSWGVPSSRLRVIISNLKLKTPRLSPKSVDKVIRDLPLPDLPDMYDYHVSYPITDKTRNEITLLNPGQGLKYFFGANQEYKNYIRVKSHEIAPVVMGKSRFIHPTEDRLLTPMEHARLMTFPDWYEYVGSLESIYDMIGEAVPPQVTCEIGKQVKDKL